MKKPIETWKKLRTNLLDKYSTSLVYVYILLYRYMEDLISQASSIAHLLNQVQADQPCLVIIRKMVLELG